MSADKSEHGLAYERRMHAEMLDNFDEELEMAIGDQRLNALITEAALPEDGVRDLEMFVPAVY